MATSVMYMQSYMGWAVRIVEGTHDCSETYAPFDGLPEAARAHLQPHTTAVVLISGMEHITPFAPAAPTVLNVCGRIMAPPRASLHPAWLKTNRQFGMIHEAFTLEGNLCIRYEQVAFKGATSRPGLGSVVREMFGGETGITMQIAVLTSKIGKAIFIHKDCLLERAIGNVPWAGVMPRLEELCNVVLFQVTDWEGAQAALGLRWAQAPTSTTVSVSRRGVLTLRMTWRGLGREWVDNDDLLDATGRMTAFVTRLV